MTELRRGLPPLPKLLEHLPIDERGYPVPWFVCKVDGKWDVRVADARKRRRALKERLCWLCGVGMGAEMAFVIGPMCAVNRNTSEPGCHLACAIFAAQACPFMTRPAAQYRQANLPVDGGRIFGALDGNPGVTCIWITRSFKTYSVYPVPGGERLIRLGPPVEVLWYCEGKPATREQVENALTQRLPILQDMAAAEGPEAEQLLEALVAAVRPWLPTRGASSVGSQGADP